MSSKLVRFLFSLLGLFVVMVCLVRIAVAQEPPSGGPPMSEDEAAIRQAYKDWDRFLLERDLDSVTAMMMKDASFESNGKKYKVLAWRRAYDTQVTSLVHCHTRIDGIRVQGKTADVKTWCEQRYTNLHIDGTEKKKFIIRSASLDQWVKTPEGWRLKSSKQQEVDVEPIE